MPEEPKTSLYVVGNKVFADRLFEDSGFPEAVRNFLQYPRVRYVSGIENIPKEHHSCSVLTFR